MNTTNETPARLQNHTPAPVPVPPPGPSEEEQVDQWDGRDVNDKEAWR